jgi:hypothetical protein
LMICYRIVRKECKRVASMPRPRKAIHRALLSQVLATMLRPNQINQKEPLLIETY